MKLSPTLLSLATIVGGLLLPIGVLLPLFMADFMYAFLVFTLGTVLFAGAQFLTPFTSKSFTARRLHRQQLLGAAFLLVTSVLMYMHWQSLPPFRGDEWKISLAIAVVFELYTAFRLPSELKKAREV